MNPQNTGCTRDPLPASADLASASVAPSPSIPGDLPRQADAVALLWNTATRSCILAAHKRGVSSSGGGCGSATFRNPRGWGSTEYCRTAAKTRTASRRTWP